MTLALDRIRELEEANRRLGIENARLRGLLSTERTRRSYPEKAACLVCGQPSPRLRRGLCPAHYQAWRRRQKPEPLGSMSTQGITVR